MEIIHDLGGWPILDDLWDPSGFKLETLLATIRRDFDESILIGSLIAPDDKNSSQYVLQV